MIDYSKYITLEEGNGVGNHVCADCGLQSMMC